MNKWSKFLTSIGICFTIILFVSFILTYMNIIDIRIVSEVKFTSTQTILGNLVMFMINMFFVFSISLLVFDRKIIAILLGYIPVIAIAAFVPSDKTLLISGAIPSIYVIVVASLYFKSNIYKILISHGLLGIVTTLYQQFSGFIKLNNFGFHYYTCNIAVMFIYSIDLYLFYILLYLGVKNYVAKHSGKMAFRTFRFFEDYRKEILKEYESNKEDVSDMTIRQQRVFCILVWTYLIVQLFVVVGINIAINKFLYFLGGFYIGILELAVSLLALELFRLSLGKSFHSKNPIICNVVSICVFFIISRLGFPLHISLFFNIMISAFVAYVIHRYVSG